jgi:hypothetical protein
MRVMVGVREGLGMLWLTKEVNLAVIVQPGEMKWQAG